MHLFLYDLCQWDAIGRCTLKFKANSNGLQEGQEVLDGGHVGQQDGVVDRDGRAECRQLCNPEDEIQVKNAQTSEHCIMWTVQVESKMSCRLELAFWHKTWCHR